MANSILQAKTTKAAEAASKVLASPAFRSLTPSLSLLVKDIQEGLKAKEASNGN